MTAQGSLSQHAAKKEQELSPASLVSGFGVQARPKRSALALAHSIHKIGAAHMVNQHNILDAPKLCMDSLENGTESRGH